MGRQITTKVRTAVACFVAIQLASWHTVQANTVAVTEFINNVTGNESTDEWVELFNYGASSVTLNGWKIEDEDVDSDLIPTITISPGDFAIVAKNKAAFETQWLGGVVDSRVVEVSGLTLGNSSDEIILKNAADTAVWTVAYPNGESEGKANFLSTDFDQFATTTFGSKAAPGVDHDADDTVGFLGYEKNNSTTDVFAVTSTTGDVGSPLTGNYVSSANLPTTGDVAFIGYNGDGNDDLALVALSDLKKGTVIRLSDNEWTGAALNTGEDAVTWVATEDIPAGTVVTFNSLGASSPGPSASFGELIFDGTTALLLNVSSEAVYAFLGTDAETPSIFLAAIANHEDMYDGTDGTLTGTGLVQGLTAVLLPNSTDIGQYVGPRSGQTSFSGYLPLIGDVGTNWVTQGGSGDQSDDDTTPDVPFDTTPFRTTIPEPSALALAALGLMLLGMRRRK